MNSLALKINNVNNKIELSNDDCDDNNNELNFCFVDTSNTPDHNWSLRLKALGKRQVEKLVSSRLYHIFSSSFSIGK